jgi:anti-sigma factor RsiW
MSNPSRLTEKEHADLVAFLDGELTAEDARAMEAKLHLNPALRAEAEALKRTWDMLDFLPRPEPSPNFTNQTLSKLNPIRKADADRTTPWRRLNWRTSLLAAGWAAALVFSVLAGYQGYQRLAAHEPGDAELVRDLRLIENKRYYDLIQNVEFLDRLDQPDLFGDDSANP